MKLKKTVSAFVLSCAVLGAGATAAFASTTTVDGVGRWDYGTNSSKVWSNLYHPNKTHKTSVEGSSTVDSGWVSKGNTSYASSGSRWWAVDKSYWDVQ